MSTIRKTLFYILLIFGLFLLITSITFHIWAFIKHITPPPSYSWMTGFTSGLLYLVLAGGIRYENSKVCLYGLIVLSSVWVLDQFPKLFKFVNEPLIFYISLFYVILHFTFLVLSVMLLRRKA